ncbi:hypothetical protein PROFUN_08914 [Planoprotostelium fungivorum]|uniref:F-box domain-containing protein n=1 Tax=Planoprotostelium fungivorum TaxID=1890364 RepID=A0A2P6NIU1_9EUKA|nr:hypothetical protein PROFUN_08914 [Planoprotostelium fungivorum]
MEDSCSRSETQEWIFIRQATPTIILLRRVLSTSIQAAGPSQALLLSSVTLPGSFKGNLGGSSCHPPGPWFTLGTFFNHSSISSQLQTSIAFKRRLYPPDHKNFIRLPGEGKSHARRKLAWKTEEPTTRKETDPQQRHEMMMTQWSGELPLTAEYKIYGETRTSSFFGSSSFIKNLVTDVSKLWTSISKEKINVSRPLAVEEGDLGDLELLLTNRDVLFHLLSLLRPKDLANLCRVSRKMNFYASHNYVWKSLFDREKKKAPRELIERLSYRELYQHIFRWEWDDAKKSTGLSLVDDSITATRPQQESPANPCVMSKLPFNRIKDSYEVTIRNKGTWLGIGVSDSNLRLQNESTLGKQRHGFNSAFFCQDTTVLQTKGHLDVQVQQALQTGDRLKVKIDFEQKRVLYYRNGKLEGVVNSKVPLKEGELYPVVNLSFTSSVSFVNS